MILYTLKDLTHFYELDYLRIKDMPTELKRTKHKVLITTPIGTYT